MAVPSSHPDSDSVAATRRQGLVTSAGMAGLDIVTKVSAECTAIVVMLWKSDIRSGNEQETSAWSTGNSGVRPARLDARAGHGHVRRKGRPRPLGLHGRGGRPAPDRSLRRRRREPDRHRRRVFQRPLGGDPRRGASGRSSRRPCGDQGAAADGRPYPLWHQLAGSADRLSAADESVLGPHLREAQA